MRELALAGFVAVAFGLGSFYATDHFGAFSLVNLVLGGAAFATALAMGARRVRFTGGPHSRPVILRGLGLILAALVAAVSLERAAAWSGVRFDWTFEQRYALDPSVVELVEQLPGLTVDLVYDPLDPRVRRTRLLLEELSRYGDVEVNAYDFDQVPEEVEEYAIGSSNSLLLRLGDRFQTVERPDPGRHLRSALPAGLGAGRRDRALARRG